MRIINNRHHHSSELIQAEGFFDEPFLAFKSIPCEVDGEGLAEDTHNIVISVKRATDGGGDETFIVMLFESFLNGGFSCSGLAQEQTESSLLAVNAEGVMDFLLMCQQRDGFR